MSDGQPTRGARERATADASDASPWAPPDALLERPAAATGASSPALAFALFPRGGVRKRPATEPFSKAAASQAPRAARDASASDAPAVSHDAVLQVAIVGGDQHETGRRHHRASQVALAGHDDQRMRPRKALHIWTRRDHATCGSGAIDRVRQQDARERLRPAPARATRPPPQAATSRNAPSSSPFIDLLSLSFLLLLFSRSSISPTPPPLPRQTHL